MNARLKTVLLTFFSLLSVGSVLATDGYFSTDCGIQQQGQGGAGMNEEPTQTTVSKPEAEDSVRTTPATQEDGPAVESNSSSQERSETQSLCRSWKRMAEREEESEPDWLSPLATTSGRIKNEFRYDMWRQTAPTGSTISTFGGGKGLEFIAAPRMQLLLGVPSYVEHSALRLPMDLEIYH